MKTDLQLAQACQDIYNNNSFWNQKFDVVEDVAGIRTTPDGDCIVCFRGSDCIVDWYRDFQALATQTRLGHVHSGFYIGMESLFATVSGQIKNSSIYVTGHSLGAARAWIFGAMLVRSGIIPAAIVAIAPPRAGFSDFNSILQSSQDIVRGYHNTGDPVPDVPIYLPPLEAYEQPVQLTILNVAPMVGDNSPLKCHHIQLYVEGITNMKGVSNGASAQLTP